VLLLVLLAVLRMSAWQAVVIGAASQFLGPYLPDVIGAVVCFGALLLLLRF
jgi:L-lactate permease